MLAITLQFLVGPVAPSPNNGGWPCLQGATATEEGVSTHPTRLLLPRIHFVEDVIKTLIAKWT